MNYTIYSPLAIQQNRITIQWYLRMPSIFQENREIVAEKNVEYQELLRKRIEAFRRDLDNYWEQVQEYNQWGDIDELDKYKRKASLLDNRLIAAMEKIDSINEEEAAYGWELSQYQIRKKTHDLLTPYKKLFDAGQDFMEKRELWLTSQVGTFNPDEIDNDIGTIHRAVMKLEKQFGDSKVTRQLAGNVIIMICFVNFSF